VVQALGSGEEEREVKGNKGGLCWGDVEREVCTRKLMEQRGGGRLRRRGKSVTMGLSGVPGPCRPPTCLLL